MNKQFDEWLASDEAVDMVVGKYLKTYHIRVNDMLAVAFRAGMLAAADIAYRSAGRCSTVIASRIRKAAGED